MQTFDALLRQAVSGLLARNLTLTEEAAGRACADASVQLLRKICALALDILYRPEISRSDTRRPC